MRDSLLFTSIPTRRPDLSAVGLILMYHRITEMPLDVWDMCVSPANFREHLEVLRTYTCIPLTQMGHEKKKAAIQVAITFDDGYADNLYNAIPALESFDIPATFFVTTGGIETSREFWWDELAQLILTEVRPVQIALQVGHSLYRWNLETNEVIGPPDHPQPWWPPTDTPRVRVYRSLYQILQCMQQSERSRAMQVITATCATTGSSQASYRRLDWDEVLRLSRHKLAEIGAHSVTHAKLSSCTHAQQEFEIKQSKIDLEEHINRPVLSFAYPYGGADHIDETSSETVRQAGFSRACTTRRAAVRNREDCFKLPRIPVTDIKGNEFEKMLKSATKK